MKKFIALTLVMLYCGLVLGGGNSTKKEIATLTIEGKFLNEKAAYVQVQVIRTDSTMADVDCEKTPKRFSVELEKGYKYKMCFTSKSGITKCLYIEVRESGYFQVDVDFNTPASAELVYEDKSKQYKVHVVHKNEPFYVKNSN